jgi:hypothetical protein
MNHSLIIDVITIVVMSVAVFYAARLNRALMRARDGRSELAQLITSLTDAHKNAEGAIRGMKATAADYDAALQRQITVSRGLIDELALINESSNALANRLERLAPLARGGYEGTPYRAEEKPAAPLRADRSDRPVSTTLPAPKPAYAVAPKAEAKPVTVAKQAEATNSKSRAEQELFAAIETLRKGRQT